MKTDSSSRRRWLALAAVVVLSLAAAALVFGQGLSTASDALEPSNARAAAKYQGPRRAAAWNDPDDDGTRVELCGTVVADDTGAALHGAIASLRPRARPQAASHLLPGGGRHAYLARSDREGAWRIANVSLGRRAWSLAVTAQGYLPQHVNVDGPCDESPVTVRLTPGGERLHGVVRDATGGPLAEATVQLVANREVSLHRDRRAPLVATTGDDGTYTLTVEPGVYQVVARFPDYADAQRWVRVTAATKQDFALLPGGRVEGVVVRADDDEPVPFARVVVTPRSGRPTTGSDATALADEHGRFALDSMEPGEFELHGYSDGGRTASGTTIELGPGGYQTGIELRLEHAPAAYGIVVLQSDPESVIEGTTVLARGEAGTWVSEPTDASGRFVLPALAVGEYQVSVDGPTHVPNQLAATFRVADGDVEGLVLEVAAGTTVLGHVEGGGPETSVRVEVDLAGLSPSEGMPAMGNAFASTRCDAEGNFELGPVTPGTLTVVAEDPVRGSGRTQAAVTEDGDPNVVLELSTATGLEGRVLEGGAPREGLSIAAVRVDRPVNVVPPPARVSATQAPVRSAADGSFRHAGLEPGTYAVQVVDASSVLATTSDPAMVEVRADAWSSITLDLADRSGVLSGRVVDADGAPVIDAIVRADFASFSTQQTLTDEEGAFVLDELTADENVRLRVTDAAPGGTFVDRTARVGETVVVELPRGATLTVDTEGIGVGQLALQGPRSARHSLAADGTAQFVRLPEGAYRLEARGEDGHAIATVELDGRDKAVSLEGDAWATVEGILSSEVGDVEGWMVFVADSDTRVRVHALNRALLGYGSRTDADGSFSVSRVPPRRGALTLTPPHGSHARSITVSVDPRPGHTLDLGEVPASADASADQSPTP